VVSESTALSSDDTLGNGSGEDAGARGGAGPGHAPLAGDWSLWRDFALRSSGFPVSGLEVFGPGDESARLRAVAREPLFQEAVTWQNPAALANAVLRIAEGSTEKPSETRRREGVVASYWQRYCAKTDTIGFFGPLAWGRLADTGPRLRVRAGALVSERSVHLEAWAVQALAETIDPDLKVATGPCAEGDLRTRLTVHPDSLVREHGLARLDRLEAARDALASSPRESLYAVLGRLDDTFVELTGRSPVRNPGKAYGARTLAYVDCMRDLELTVGPALLDGLAPALQTLFEASRWYCGQVNAVGRRVIENALPDAGRGPFMPVLVEVLRTLMQLPFELTVEVAELQRRLAAVLLDPDPATIGTRAAAAFADHEPAWRYAVFQSVDVQLAARDEAAVVAGDYLAVIGDVHPGNNPLLQGLFADRHPDPAEFLRMAAADLGSGMAHLMAPWGPGFVVDARGVPPTQADDIYIATLPETRARDGRRTWLPHELLVDGHDLIDRTGELRVPLMDVFGLPMFVAGVRTFQLLSDEERAPRVTIGRTVVRRESWSVPASDVPQRADDLVAFARDRGMPRRLFTKSPLERKPMYLDVESPSLGRILCRQARQVAAGSPHARIRFTEMLPTAEQCWLRDPDDNRFVSELRLVAVDRTRGQRCSERG
jgi:Lantibiotic dehydratase, N terminus